jgi:hypothetical protein
MPIRVFVPIADNLTSTPNLEVYITGALRTRLGGFRDVRLVREEEGADQVLLVSVTRFLRAPGASRIGNATTRSLGGLSSGYVVAADIRLTYGIEVTLLSRKEAIPREVWKRGYELTATYEAADRQIESGAPSPELGLGGASSVPFIHASREELSLKSLADRLAGQVLDQVRQDF